MAAGKQTEWEDLVKKQLKTEDIDTLLTRENLEGVSVKPYYSESSHANAVAKVEKNTHLVCRYYPEADENTFAFLLDETYTGPAEKALFVSPEIIEDDFHFESGNCYFSLIDPFNDGTDVAAGEYRLDAPLLGRLLAKPYDRAICLDISFHQNAGASIVQQLAVALLKVSELFEHKPEVSFGQIIFRVAVGSNYFFEIAKLRALKLLLMEWQKQYGLSPETPYIFAENSFRNKTKSDPENNLIRSTLEVGAAMVAGADAVFANNYNLVEDSALVREISFKQSVVLAYESILNVFEDGAGGSFAIEDITQQFTEKAWQLFAELENSGGYLSCLQAGTLQTMIAEQAIKEQEWVATGKIKLIGVNAFPKRDILKTSEEMYSRATLRPVRWAEQFGE